MTSAWSQLPRPGITAVLGWCQALIRQGVTGDAAEAAACQHAKTSLLEQIARPPRASARTKARRSGSGGAFHYPHILSTNDSPIVTMSVRAHLTVDGEVTRL